MNVNRGSVDKERLCSVSSLYNENNTFKPISTLFDSNYTIQQQKENAIKKLAEWNWLARDEKASVATPSEVSRGYSFWVLNSWFNLQIFNILLKAVVSRHQYKRRGSGRAASLGCCWFWIGTFAKFEFGSEHFDLLMAIEVHWFGFGCLGCLCRLWGGGRGRGEALASGTCSEDMDVLDFATPQLRGIGTGGSNLQVNFLNPPRWREKIQIL